MLELSSQGAKVLQTSSVVLAMNNKLKLQVLSSFEEKKRTFIVSGEFLHQVYNQFLRGFNNHKKLPVPTMSN